MAKQDRDRKINRSLIITLPKSICDLYGIDEGSHLDLEVMTSDSFKVVVKK